MAVSSKLPWCLALWCSVTQVIAGGRSTNDAAEPVPLIVTTWANDGFMAATDKAWRYLQTTGDRLGAVVEGCSTCEDLQCDRSVGYGGSPDEAGETTVEALLMDGPQHRMGAVGGLRRIKSASRVAYAVMNYTKHSILIGEQATKFAVEMGFTEESLQTSESKRMYEDWLRNYCQQNYRQNVEPDPRSNCGPYHPNTSPTNDITSDHQRPVPVYNGLMPNHDTIGMIIVDQNKDVSVGTSTNGASHKIPGRVGDAPLPGAGAYLDNSVGGAAATGDGDVMMRFLPSFLAVELMRNGATPSEATQTAIERIKQFYPSFSGAVIAADKKGRYGAACHGFTAFRYCVFNKESDSVQIASVDCI